MYSQHHDHSIEFSSRLSVDRSFERHGYSAVGTELHSNDFKVARRIGLTRLVLSISVIIFLILILLLAGFISGISSFAEDSNDSVGLPSPSLTPWNDHPALRPLVISGPSGVGKGTLINLLFEFYNKEFESSSNSDEHHPLSFSVSHTTRGPRPGEKDGVHYHFSTKGQMQKEIDDNKFIESAEVFGNLYGTSYSAIQDVVSKGKICVLDIDIQGAKRVKEDTSITTPYFIFVAPPSMEILEKRLRDRGTETEEAIQRRTANAQKEVTYGLASGNFDDIVINDDLDKAFLHLQLILEGWYPHLNQVPHSEVVEL